MTQTSTPASPAEELADLVAELVDEVRTDESATRYKTVNRGGGRTVTVTDPHARWTVRDVGLLQQLHAVKAARTTIPVKVYRWEPDRADPCRRDYGDERDQRLCPHGQWILVRTEERPAERLGIVTAGAAVPGGSPGWDESGALNPLRSTGFESATPGTSAVELYDTIRRGAAQLRRELRAAAGHGPGGHRTTAEALRELVGLAPMVDTDTADDTVRQVRSWWRAVRIFLRYDAPIVQLRDLVCGQCGGVLHVREDASTAVWCAGHPAAWAYGPGLPGTDWGPVDHPAEPGCGERYPRGSWIKLLEQAAKENR